MAEMLETGDCGKLVRVDVQILQVGARGKVEVGEVVLLQRKDSQLRTGSIKQAERAQLVAIYTHASERRETVCA